MRTPIWFYLFWLMFFLTLSYISLSIFAPKKDIHINAFEIINTDTFENVIEYPKDSLIRLNTIFPIVIPRSAYVEKGDTFEAQIVLGTFVKNVPEIPTVFVNSRSVTFNENGIGYYSEEANIFGKKKLRIVQNIRSAISDERISGTTTYEYFVGLKTNELNKLTTKSRAREYHHKTR